MSFVITLLMMELMVRVTDVQLAQGHKALDACSWTQVHSNYEANRNAWIACIKETKRK